jgi:hypothetical protein
MQYTLRKIPKHLDRALRARAKLESKSLNEVAVEAIGRGLGLTDKPVKLRDLADISGTWCSDKKTDVALEEQREIDPELWR